MHFQKGIVFWEAPLAPTYILMLKILWKLIFCAKKKTKGGTINLTLNFEINISEIQLKLDIFYLGVQLGNLQYIKNGEI